MNDNLFYENANRNTKKRVLNQNLDISRNFENVCKCGLENANRNTKERVLNQNRDISGNFENVCKYGLVNKKYKKGEFEKYKTKELYELRDKINETIEQRSNENDKRIIIHRYSSNEKNANDKLTFEESLKAWTEDGINFFYL